MKFTQCARVRLVDASFAEAPGPLARSALHPPCSFPSFRGRSLVLVLWLVVSHPFEGIANLTNHQPRRLRCFHATGNLSAFSPGRLSPPLETSSVPLPSTFCSHSLLGDALRTAGVIFGTWCLILNTNFTAVRASTMGLTARKRMGGVWEVDTIHLFSLLRRPFAFTYSDLHPDQHINIYLWILICSTP